MFCLDLNRNLNLWYKWFTFCNPGGRKANKTKLKCYFHIWEWTLCQAAWQASTKLGHWGRGICMGLGERSVESDWWELAFYRVRSLYFQEEKASQHKLTKSKSNSCMPHSTVPGYVMQNGKKVTLPIWCQEIKSELYVQQFPKPHHISVIVE